MAVRIAYRRDFAADLVDSKRPLGREQLVILTQLGSPGRVMIADDKDRAVRGLLRRGLLEFDGESAVRVTSRGLRRLADELDAGNLARMFEAGDYRPVQSL